MMNGWMRVTVHSLCSSRIKSMFVAGDSWIARYKQKLCFYEAKNFPALLREDGKRPQVAGRSVRTETHLVFYKSNLPYYAGSPLSRSTSPLSERGTIVIVMRILAVSCGGCRSWRTRNARPYYLVNSKTLLC